MQQVSRRSVNLQHIRVGKLMCLGTMPTKTMVVTQILFGGIGAKPMHPILSNTAVGIYTSRAPHCTLRRASLDHSLRISHLPKCGQKRRDVPCRRPGRACDEADQVGLDQGLSCKLNTAEGHCSANCPNLQKNTGAQVCMAWRCFSNTMDVGFSFCMGSAAGPRPHMQQASARVLGSVHA
jgi:hypothetical protein